MALFLCAKLFFFGTALAFLDFFFLPRADWLGSVSTVLAHGSRVEVGLIEGTGARRIPGRGDIGKKCAGGLAAPTVKGTVK